MPSSRSTTFDGRRVFIVDDDEDLREMFLALLESYGAVVSAFADGASAIDAARKEPPEIALVDISLPIVSGLEVAARLRELAEGVKIIAVSGFDEPPSGEVFDAYLVKPVDFAQLEAAVASVSR